MKLIISKPKLLKGNKAKCTCGLVDSIAGYAQCIYSPVFNGMGEVVQAGVSELERIEWRCVDCGKEYDIELADGFRVVSE